MIGARSHFNVSPGNEMPVIVRHDEDAIALMRWGLIPRWTTDPTTTQRPINARAETLSGKPMFAPLLKSCRCLVPASGFFEWQKEGRRKVPFYFTVKESPIFAFAGLCDTWTGPDGTMLRTYTIITCSPNELLAPVHDRMPVILPRENEDLWLSPAPLTGPDLARVLAPYPADGMEKVPVAGLVNNPAVDDERVIRPLFGLT
jgi:putative SOS response-associated peptidase YedK